MDDDDDTYKLFYWYCYCVEKTATIFKVTTGSGCVGVVFINMDDIMDVENNQQ